MAAIVLIELSCDKRHDFRLIAFCCANTVKMELFNVVGISENNWHPSESFNLAVAIELPLKNAIYKYFQLPNHSSLPELPFKSDVYQYFQNPKTQ